MDNQNNNTNTTPKKKRGFAAMDPTRVRELAGLGGKAAHAAGTAHRFSKEEASAAGRKGGLAAHRTRGRTPVNETAPVEELPEIESNVA